MESNKKACLITAAWAGWYARGSDRLVRSMVNHGWNYDILQWKDQQINDFFDSKYPYTVKAAALHEAIEQGYTHILWMDCSQWVTGDPNVLMQQIDDNGGLFIYSGFNLAQTSADSDLQWSTIDRNQAEILPEIWSCTFGINLLTEQGKHFVNYFFDALYHGVFNTPRTHSGLSKDPRFLHARQDQTAVSWAYHLSGYNIAQDPWNILKYYDGQPDKLIQMRGM